MHRAATTPVPTRTGWLLAALAAIPVVSVSAVAIVSDVASGTDPARLWSGLAAALAGVGCGLVVVRLAHAVRTGLLTLSTAILRCVGSELSETVLGEAIRPVRAGVTAPAMVTLPVVVRRRGPPVVLH